jgi:hypothetical protein
MPILKFEDVSDRAIKHLKVNVQKVSEGEHARPKRRRGLSRRVEAEAIRKRLAFRSATPV